MKNSDAQLRNKITQDLPFWRQPHQVWCFPCQSVVMFSSLTWFILMTFLYITSCDWSLVQSMNKLQVTETVMKYLLRILKVKLANPFGKSSTSLEICSHHYLRNSVSLILISQCGILCKYQNTHCLAFSFFLNF